MKSLLSTAAAAAITVVTFSAAHAATNNTNMGVSATVSRTCTVTANALAFGVISETGAATSSAISITCTAGSADDAPIVTFSGGLQPVGGIRQMTGGDSGAALVPYTLASSEGGENLTASAPVATTATNNGINYSTTVYGRIAAGAYEIGTFNDTVTVQVTYENGVPAVDP